MPEVTTYIDKDNWTEINNNPGQDYYVLIDMNNKNVHFDDPEAVYEDGYDHIDLTGTGLKNFVDIRGRKQEDSIYGAENAVNFLYGDGVWNFWGHEVDSNTNYNKYVGSDRIVGGDNFNYIHGGKGNDVLIGGTDTNFYSFRKNDGAAIIMPSTGWNYLYFAEVKAKDMTFAYIKYEEQEGHDPEISISPTYTPNLGIIAGGTQVVALNYFLGNSRIFDKDTNMSNVKDLIGEVQQQEATMDEVKTALNEIAGIDVTIYAPVDEKDNIVQFGEGDPTTYTVANVGKAYTLTINDPSGKKYDLDEFQLYKAGNNLELRHTSGNIVVLKDYFKLAEGKALKEVNGVSLIEQKLNVSYLDNESEVQKGTLNGTYFNDVILAGEGGVTINAGKRDDEITGSTGDDKITGGLGINTIYYSGGDDTINLTSGEDMIVDVKSKGVDYYSKEGNDLVINLDGSEKIKIKNFIKSNGVGKGSAHVKVGGEYFDLNKDIMVSGGFDIKESKKTFTYTGTRLSDNMVVSSGSIASLAEYKYTVKAGEGDNRIDLYDAYNTNTITSGSGKDEIYLNNTSDTEQFDKALTTVKAGEGENKIYVDGSGNNSIVTGKNDDRFFFCSDGESDATTTIKAGGGKNHIYINDDDFGNITLAEEKIKETRNNIVFDNSTIEGINDATKTGNDLKISTESSLLTIKDYFLQTGKYAEKWFYEGTETEDNKRSLKALLNDMDLKLNVTGSGTVNGTALDENISTVDSANNYDPKKAKNDKIYSGAGDDIINAGYGKNQIIVKAGDGVDIVSNSTLGEDKAGQDTLVFDKGAKIRFGYVNPQESVDGTEYDVRIYYSDNATDYILLEDFALYNDETGDYEYFFDDTSIKTLKVGSKSYKLTDLLDRKTIKGVTGTIGNDDIWVNKTGKQNIVANAGSDIVYIGSNDDKNEDNIDPAKYMIKNITPTVYTYTNDGVKDTSEGTFDKVISYANNGGKYYAQSDQNDIKVYGNYTKDGVLTGTDDTYYTNISQFTKIADESGNDTLYINDASSNSLTLLFDVTKDYEPISKAESYSAENIKNSFQEVKILTTAQLNDFIENYDEYIDEKGNLSLPSVGIDIDYWGDKADRTSADDLVILNQYNGYFGSGVETISANDGNYITADDIAEVAEAVATWLNVYTETDTGKSFDSVKDAFEHGTDDTRSILLSVFADNNPWVQQPE